MTVRRHHPVRFGNPSNDVEMAPADWRVLGARIRRAAMVAATMHLVRVAGGRLDDGAVVETPRVLPGG